MRTFVTVGMVGPRYKSPDGAWCVEVWSAGTGQEYRVLWHGALMLTTPSLERVAEYLRGAASLDLGDLVED